MLPFIILCCLIALTEFTDSASGRKDLKFRRKESYELSNVHLEFCNDRNLNGVYFNGKEFKGIRHEQGISVGGTYEMTRAYYFEYKPTTSSFENFRAYTESFHREAHQKYVAITGAYLKEGDFLLEFYRMVVPATTDEYIIYCSYLNAATSNSKMFYEKTNVSGDYNFCGLNALDNRHCQKSKKEDKNLTLIPLQVNIKEQCTKSGKDIFKSPFTIIVFSDSQMYFFAREGGVNRLFYLHKASPAAKRADFVEIQYSLKRNQTIIGVIEINGFRYLLFRDTEFKKYFFRILLDVRNFTLAPFAKFFNCEPESKKIDMKLLVTLSYVAPILLLGFFIALLYCLSFVDNDKKQLFYRKQIFSNTGFSTIGSKYLRSRTKARTSRLRAELDKKKLVPGFQFQVGRQRQDYRALLRKIRSEAGKLLNTRSELVGAIVKDEQYICKPYLMRQND